MCVRILIRELSMSASRLSVRELSFTSSLFKACDERALPPRSIPYVCSSQNCALYSCFASQVAPALTPARGRRQRGRDLRQI